MPTANMSLDKPTVGSSVDVWGTSWNGNADLLDAHDHTAGKGARIPTAGLNINADLPFGGFGLTGLKVLDFNAVTAITSGYLTSLFVSSADNELYWRSNGGVNVKLTSGSSLNAALLGGFTGASYGTGGAEVNYDGATKIYNHLQAANHRGKIDCADIRLFEATSGISNAVKLKSPAALAASYDWTLPAALPASTKLLQVTSAGQLQFTGASTHDGNLAVSGTLSATGAATLSSSLAVSGALSGAAALTYTGRIAPAVSANQNDWAPTGIGTALVIEAAPTGAPRTITGISASQTVGRMLIIVNVGSENLILSTADAASLAANRFDFPTSITVPVAGGVTLIYRNDSRWCCIGRNTT